MKIAVTGATGFLGHYIVAQLAGAGHSLRCWHRPASDRGGLESLAERIEWLSGELGDRAAAARLVEGCEAVVHAALFHDRSLDPEENLLEFVERNVVGSLQLIEAARAAGAERFVYISSCAVHNQILDDRPLDETHPTWATSHYGAHKAAVEQFVQSYGFGQNYPICALRPTGIYGLARPAQESKWYELIAAVVRGEPVECRRGGKEVHAADVARAAEILLTADGIAGQCYNCCDRYVSEFEVATIAKQLSDSLSPIGGGPTTPKHQIVTDKLQRLGMKFGGRPLLEQTIAQIVAVVGRGP